MPQPLDDFYEELGRRVRLFREKCEMTQSELGQRLQPRVTRASIANIEAGSQRVLAHTLVQLAAILGTNVVDLTPAWNREESAGKPEKVNLEEELAKLLPLSVTEIRKLAKNLKLS